MKRLLIALLITVTTLAAALPSAEARRLGGGGSFGKQSSYSRQSSATPSQPYNAASAAKPAAPAAAPGAAAPAKPASPLRNILGGALLGLGVGALLSHFGLGGAFGSMISTILMIALLAFVAMFLVRMFSRKSGQPAAGPAYAGGASSAARSYTPEIGSQVPDAPKAFQSESSGSFGGAGGSAAAQAVALGVPADFDVPGFVRNAKSYFIRLQAAGDRADIHDLREFTSPEMFAELRLQIQERGASPNVTDVVQLNGELLGIEKNSDEYIATVRFNGLIKEAPDTSAEAFVELWNFSKPVDGSAGWVLAGIQQAS
jgi:predicted lipid-binding transport protein (Tim44 family)